MGASEFFTKAMGKTAKEAFKNAVSEAFHMSGHGGYTGTIAEKESFKLYLVPVGENPFEFAEKKMQEDDTAISDKWGPAGCVKIKDNEYLFFGWASS